MKQVSWFFPVFFTRELTNRMQFFVKNQSCLYPEVMANFLCIGCLHSNNSCPAIQSLSSFPQLMQAAWQLGSEDSSLLCCQAQSCLQYSLSRDDSRSSIATCVCHSASCPGTPWSCRGSTACWSSPASSACTSYRGHTHTCSRCTS